VNPQLSALVFSLRELLSKFPNVFSEWRPINVAGIAMEHKFARPPSILKRLSGEA